MKPQIGRQVKIHPTARLEAEELSIGDFTQIGANVHIHGAKVEIGRDAWIANNVLIGGGRAEMGSLRTGDFLHLGIRSMINIADKVVIGDEVGIGIESKLYTHGAYLNEYEGFPYSVGRITIGNRVWIPNAIILPDVDIGDDIVIGAQSLVNGDIPSGCFAAGSPIKVLKEDEYPKELSFHEHYAMTERIVQEIKFRGIKAVRNGRVIVVGKTTFYPVAGRIEGPANKDTDLVKDMLRRHGARFKYYNDGEIYREWD